MATLENKKVILKQKVGDLEDTIARGQVYIDRTDDEIEQLIFDTRRGHFFFPAGAPPPPRNLVSMF